jgi:hypothetical protein
MLQGAKKNKESEKAPSSREHNTVLLGCRDGEDEFMFVYSVL